MHFAENYIYDLKVNSGIDLLSQGEYNVIQQRFDHKLNNL